MSSSHQGQSTWRGERGGGWGWGWGWGRGRGRGRGEGRGRGRGRGGHREYSAQRQSLVNIANETKSVLPFILKDLPNVKADESELLSIDDLHALAKSDCPRHPRATIKILNEDTFNAAVMLKDSIPSSTNIISPNVSNRVAVLNLASEKSPGGGWLNGAMAQEEALCYRSSLSLSLHKHYYPWNHLQGLYTRDVVIIRSSTSDGHALLSPRIAAADLPVVSVLSVAAIRRPKLSDAQTVAGEHRKVFANASDRDLTKSKMRLTLRMAVVKGHDYLVLGAMGCGAFHNPPEEIAEAWKEVLEEEEFSGGWWREIWFAVLDPKNEGNFEIFQKVLGGMEV